MKRFLWIILLSINVVFYLWSQEFDYSKYKSTTMNELAKLPIHERIGFYRIFGHYIVDWPCGEGEIAVGTDRSVIRLECPISPPYAELGRVIVVYFQVSYSSSRRRNSSSIYYIIDKIELTDQWFIIGDRYRAIDNLIIRETSSRDSKRIGMLLNYDYAWVIEIGRREIIDGIESNWLKIRTVEGFIGWCFGGYLEYWNRSKYGVDLY